MSETTKMTNPKFLGAANVKPENVEAWKAKGWREANPVKKTPKQDATAKGQTK